MADIQFADRRIFSSKTSAAAMLHNDSATAILADAPGLIRAMVGFSPIAVAVPVLIPFCKQVAVTPTSATGTCLRRSSVSNSYENENLKLCNIVNEILFPLTTVPQADP